MTDDDQPVIASKQPTVLNYNLASIGGVVVGSLRTNHSVMAPTKDLGLLLKKSSCPKKRPLLYVIVNILRMGPFVMGHIPNSNL